MVEALALLETGKFQKAVAFVCNQAAERVRTNNHVERANRRFRCNMRRRYQPRTRFYLTFPPEGG